MCVYAPLTSRRRQRVGEVRAFDLSPPACKPKLRPAHADTNDPVPIRGRVGVDSGPRWGGGLGTLARFSFCLPPRPEGQRDASARTRARTHARTLARSCRPWRATNHRNRCRSEPRGEPLRPQLHSERSLHRDTPRPRQERTCCRDTRTPT